MEMDQPMPSPLRLPDGSYLRHTDAKHILGDLNNLHCVEITGFSNLGKSALMRLLAQPDVWLRELGEAGGKFLPVYVDCNRMLEMTDQGFYELVLRCLQESSPPLAEDSNLTAAYETLIAPASEFQVPLSFSKGLTAALSRSERKIVLLFDEFDEPFQHIDSRVFLNLRAKRDRFSETLIYATATTHPLAELRPGDHCGEFCELFAHHPWRLAPLTLPDVERSVQSYAEEHSLALSLADAEFVYQWTGGHPGMLEVVCRLLGEAVQAEDENADRWATHRTLVAQMRRDVTLRNEAEKIWHGLTVAEQAALVALSAGQHADDDQINRLHQRHLLLTVEGEKRVFSRVFASYLQQKQTVVPPATARLQVDRESGEVLIKGKSVETLTRLEYQLMVMLFENADKIVDKYQIVTGVWGDDYIDSVDDARIEKLVSRLRQKVEPDPSNPQFITTVRGRGYRLLLA